MAIFFLIFVFIASFYVFSFLVCRSKFKLSEEQISAFLSDEQSFSACDDENNVLSKGTALFVRKYFFIIPLSDIQSTKVVNSVVEHDIYINFKNGKKMVLATDKKTAGTLKKAFEANIQQ